MSTQNTRNAGRKPKQKKHFLFDVENLDDAETEIRNLCQDEGTKQIVLELLNQVRQEILDTKTQETQTCPNLKTKGAQTDEISPLENIMSSLPSLPYDDLLYLFHNLFHNIGEEDRVIHLFSLLENLDQENQEAFFESLGALFNQDLFKASLSASPNTKELTISELLNVHQSDLFAECDPRLKSFLKSATEKKKYRSNNDKESSLSNVFENILKARNSKFVSASGLKEHLIAYISSGKNHDVSDLMSHIGGKGSRHIVESIIRNSELQFSFKAPENVTILVTFDNIQKLMKSHRLSGLEQQKVYAVVVTSLLATLPDGYTADNIQFEAKNAPSNWAYDLTYNEKTKVFIENIDSKILTSCIPNTSVSDEKILSEYWEQELELELEEIIKDVDEDGSEDSIDLKVKEKEAKRIKFCSEGHENRGVTGRRKYCMENSCRAPLQSVPEKQPEDEHHNSNHVSLSADEQRSIYYMKVPNITNECDQVEELPIGAIPVNPNNLKRVNKVLDYILEATELTGKYSTKYIIEDEKNIRKDVIETDEERTWILVSCDGLPFNHLREIVKNSHTCIICKEKLEYITEISEHFQNTQHTEFYQTYGSVILNYGGFHYMQTSIRSYTKLNWEIDFEELCKAMKLDTPKALFMIEKVTDFRKSLDFIRSCRKAKIRELLTPFVKHCKENNLQVSVGYFFLWLKTFVKNKTYLSVYNIEKYFGTSLLLFLSSMRSNNYPTLRVAKRIFSSLFHVNNNPNYAGIDIWTDYYDEKMRESNPELYEYLETRRFTNKTGKNYGFEPHDERHEEYNRRGMHFQRNRTTEEFATSFALVESYTKLKHSVFEDYGKKSSSSSSSYKTQDYSDNIENMRVLMRSKEYLKFPEEETNIYSLSGKKLNENLLRIKETSDKAKRENILKVIKYNDFKISFASNKYNIFEGKNDRGLKLEDQARILISSEENPEIRANLLEYWRSASLEKEFNLKQFVEDLITNQFSFV